MPSRAFQQASIISSDGALTGVTVTPSQISDQANTSTGYIDLPSGTTAQRPVSTTSGSVRYNTTLATVEVYNGTSWLPVGTVYDAESSSTGFFDLPSGTTAQRPVTPSVGMMRYNSTTGFAEVYTQAGWGIFGALPPSISSVTPISFNGEQGTVFTINGNNFTNDVTVKFITSSSIEYSAATVVFLSSTQLTATTSRDFTVAEEPLSIKVSQGSGVMTATGIIDCGGTPSWSTSAGVLATINDRYGSYSPIVTVSASDPDTNSTVSYSVTSGSLPAGISLNTSTGAISGDPTDVVAQTTSNFDITATDNAGNTTSRSFNIVVNLTKDGSSSDRAAKSPYALRQSIGSTPTSGVYWFSNTGYNSGTAFQAYADWSTDATYGMMVICGYLIADYSAVSFTNFGTAATASSGTPGFRNTHYLPTYTLLSNWTGNTRNRCYLGMTSQTGGTNIDTATKQWLLMNLSLTTFRDMFDNAPGVGAYDDASGIVTTSTGASGRLYYTTGHGNSIYQMTNSGNTVNSGLWFETRDGGNDTNHTPMVWAAGNGSYAAGGNPFLTRWMFLGISPDNV
jgi:hypothetical protein